MENVPAAPNQAPPPAAPAQSAPASTGTSVVDDTVKNKDHPFWVGINMLPYSRIIFMILAFVFAIVMAGLILMFWAGDNYKPLVGTGNAYESRDLIELLQQQAIDFNIDIGTGVISVPESQLHAARLALAASGMADDQTVGYELLDQDQGLGTSQFKESTQYHRSLEGELAKTIRSINKVRSARVHLAIPKRSVFVRDVREPSASVFLDLYAGASLNEKEVTAILNLVSTSISDLTPSHVTVVDHRGQLLSDFGTDSDDEITSKQLEYTKKIENRLQQSISNILMPVIGSDGFKAQVNANIDFTKTEQAEEFYNPDLIAVRSEQIISEENVGETNGGIPGALSNQPPGEATAPEEAGGANGEGGPPSNKRNESTRNYEVDKTLSFTQFAQGRIARLTVAVVVDDLFLPNEEGVAVRTPWSENDIIRLETLVRDSVGFNASRGDSVNVINTPFMAEADIIEPVAWYESDNAWKFAQLALAFIFILTVFILGRNTLRQITAAGQDQQEDDEDAIAKLDIDEDAIADDKVTLSVGDEYVLPGPSEGFERHLDALRGLIAEDPGKVAQVLKAWVNAE